MSPLRIAFLLVFVAAAVAFFIARSAVASISLGPEVAQLPAATPTTTSTPKPRVKPSPRPTHPAPAPTSPPPTATPQPSPTLVPAATTAPKPTPTDRPAPVTARRPRPAHVVSTPRPRRAVPVPRARKEAPRPQVQKKGPPTRRAEKTPVTPPKRQVALVRRTHHRHSVRPTPTPKPSPTPGSGVITISNYWISQSAVKRGTTIAVGYTIDNGTGRVQRVLLGASIKPAVVATWGRSVSDPFHDVVATVPPGITTHVRYFTLARGLRLGQYDVAWGLRSAVTGASVALVTAPDSLTVTR